MARAKRRKKKSSSTCDQWERGVCLHEAKRTGQVLYCPEERASNIPSGMCSHHPVAFWQSKLVEMKRAGINLSRYGTKILKPTYVMKLYASFRRALRKKSQNSS